MTLPCFPEWLQEHELGDKAFMQAYEALTAPQRSRLKLCLAQLYESFQARTPGAVLAQSSTLALAGGLVDTLRWRPAAWCLVLLDEAMVSPSRLLAAVTPALLSGVEELRVVRLCAKRAPWPPALLTALELAGVERVARMSAARCAVLAKYLAQNVAPGVILVPQPVLGVSAGARQTMTQTPGLRFWQPVFKGAAGLYAGDASSPGELWNLEALAWSQPDLELELWCMSDACEGEDLPPGWKVRQGSVEGFLRQGYELVYAPEILRRQALNSASLVLGPGQESCWIWPDLQPCFFRQHAAAWSFSNAAAVFQEDEQEERT